MDLLERDAALADLELALADAMRGEGRLVLVCGEAGIGKTSVLERFAREQRARVRVLWGGCDALFTPRPLGPLHEMASHAGEPLASLLTHATDRGALYAGLMADLQRRPSLIVVEDAHWADDATLDVLRYVGRRIARTSSLLVLTYRDDELAQGHPLRTLLSDLASSTATVRTALPALSELAVRALVGARGIDAAVLHRQTGGNPFFVTEVLSSGAEGLPLSVRDAVLGRIARLSRSAMAVLDAAAVAGPRVEPWLLAAVVSDDVHAADECLARGVLVEHGGTFGFRHELARQVVLDSIVGLRRAQLHRLTLHALEGSEVARGDVSRLAHHAQGANDDRAILTYAPAAARHAAAAGAHRTAADLLARTLRSSEGLPAADLAALLETYAWECHHVADLEHAIAAWREAADLRRALGDRPREGQDLALLAVALSSAGQRDAARYINQAAIDLLAAQPPGRELAIAYGTQAILHQYRHELADAIALAERAIALAERTGDRQILTMAYDTLGMSSMYMDYERGRRHLEHARDIALQAGLDADVARAYGDLGVLSVRLFQLDRAERYLNDGLAFTAERDLDRTRLYMLGWLAVAHLLRGRWIDAETTAQAVLSTPASSNARLAALLTLGRVAARRGERERASAMLDEALEIAGAADELRLIGPVRAARAEAAFMVGDLATTRAEADAAYGVAVDKHHDWLAGELAYWRWRAGACDAPPDWIAGPYAFHIAGDWRAAADAWDRLGCPYEQASALADGDPAAQTRALAIFDRLLARPAAGGVRRALRDRGVARVPRGARATTRANRFGLTLRQLEILDLLAEGCTNAEIAERMSITRKTTEHHVSAVLAKLEVTSRRAAVRLARSGGPLPGSVL